MFHMMKHKPVMFGAVLLMVAMAMAQSQREREALSVQGYQGQASSHSIPWTCVRGRAGPGANHKRLSQL